MIVKHTLIAVGLVALLLSFGCASSKTTGAVEETEAPEAFRQPLTTGWQGDRLIAENHVAGDGLVANLTNRLPVEARILCSTFVNRDNFDETSSFGRLISAQYVSRLAQAGFGVTEIRLRRELGIRVREGEFALSRKTAQYMRENYNAHAILVGSYTVDRDAVFVSSRVVRLDSGVVVAAYDYVVPNRGMVSRLLEGEDIEQVEFAGYLRPRAGVDTQAYASSPTKAQPMSPQPNDGLLPPTRGEGPFRLFPPTRVQ